MYNDIQSGAPSPVPEPPPFTPPSAPPLQKGSIGGRKVAVDQSDKKKNIQGPTGQVPGNLASDIKNVTLRKSSSDSKKEDSKKDKISENNPFSKVFARRAAIEDDSDVDYHSSDDFEDIPVQTQRKTSGETKTAEKTSAPPLPPLPSEEKIKLMREKLLKPPPVPELPASAKAMLEKGQTYAKPLAKASPSKMEVPEAPPMGAPEAPPMGAPDAPTMEPSEMRRRSEPGARRRSESEVEVPLPRSKSLQDQIKEKKLHKSENRTPSPKAKTETPKEDSFQAFRRRAQEAANKQAEKLKSKDDDWD